MRMLTDQDAWYQLILAGRSISETDKLNRNWNVYYRTSIDDPEHNWVPVVFDWCLMRDQHPNNSDMPCMECRLTPYIYDTPYTIYNDVNGRHCVVLVKRRKPHHAEAEEEIGLAV